MRRQAEARARAGRTASPPAPASPGMPGLSGLVSALQRRAGNKATAEALTNPRSAPSGAPDARLALQRVPVGYEPNESATATARGIITPDVRLLAGTASSYDAASNSILVADFRPNSAVGIRADIADAAIADSATKMPDVLKTKASGWRAFMRGGRYMP